MRVLNALVFSWRPACYVRIGSWFRTVKNMILVSFSDLGVVLVTGYTSDAYEDCYFWQAIIELKKYSVVLKLTKLCYCHAWKPGVTAWTIR